MSALRLYYDLSCPWSYLALVRLQDAADRNATPIELRPIVVDAVLATENPPLLASRLAANPAKATWQRKDLDDWARFWGLILNLPANWPCDASLAAAACAIAIEQGKGMAYSLKVFTAYFSNGDDITSAELLADLAADTGLDRADFSLQLQQTDVSEKIAGWSEELIRQGGFGTPSVFVDDQLFFGNDRIPLAEWAMGPISDADFVMPGQHN
jgi:2-hydroxychromene-2-carboxylate isomerase